MLLFFFLFQTHLSVMLSFKTIASRKINIRMSVQELTSISVPTTTFNRNNDDFYAIQYQPIKLPVWPVWSGVIAQVMEWLKLNDVSEKIIETIGGRVVPMSLSESPLSPFLLLAHHCHSFTPLDPFRAITNLILPEGFPAHPHSGFDTVTYCLEGGLRHRDSEGLGMAYGDGEVQWMRAGRGVIHEEMWDLSDSEFKHKKIEIFQLWVNLKSKHKSDPPIVCLIKNNDIPIIYNSNKDIKVKVISGDINNQMNVEVNNNDNNNNNNIAGPGIAKSNIDILHVSMEKRDSKITVKTKLNNSVFVYVRRGSLIINNNNDDNNENIINVTPGNYVIYKSSYSADNNQLGSFTVTCGSKGFDGLVLIGEPLGERVLASGPFVESDEQRLAESSRIFSGIGGQAYWDYKISDEEWKKHCNKLDLQNVIVNNRS